MPLALTTRTGTGAAVAVREAEVAAGVAAAASMLESVPRALRVMRTMADPNDSDARSSARAKTVTGCERVRPVAVAALVP